MNNTYVAFSPSGIPMVVTPIRLGRENRLNNEGFRVIFDKGNRYRGRLCDIVIFSAGDEIRRLGIVASRKLGSAVVRNRFKRRIRDIMRLGGGPFTLGMWVVVIGKPEAATADYKSLADFIYGVLRRYCDERNLA